MMIDRRNKRSVQIFFLLISSLICFGIFFYNYSNPVDEVPDYFPPEVKEQQKAERESALEKVRQLQQNGFGNVAAETYYDDQSKKLIPGNQDNSGFENARALFQKMNSTSGNDNQLNENGEKLTADAFYDEKLKQKQEEDSISEQKSVNENEEPKTIQTAIKTDENLKQEENSDNKKR